MKKQIVIFLSILESISCYSQNSSPAFEIIEKYLRALGGREKLKSIKTVRFEMEGILNGEKYNVKMILFKPRRMLAEFAGPGHIEKRVLNGDQHVRILNGEKVPLADSDLVGMIEDSKIFPALTYEQDGYKVMVHGEKPYFPGYIEVELITASYKRRVHYYNIETGLLGRVLNDSGIEYNYSEYAEFEGILYPTKVMLKVSGREM